MKDTKGSLERKKELVSEKGIITKEVCEVRREGGGHGSKRNKIYGEWDETMWLRALLVGEFAIPLQLQ